VPSSTASAYPRLISAVALAAVALAATGCGGTTTGLGGLSAPPRAASAQSAAGTAQVRLTFRFPETLRTTAARGRAYVSASIASLGVALNDGTPTFVNAPPVSASRTVTLVVPANVGTNSFTFAEYDMADGQGNLLGRTTQSATVISGTVNDLSFTLDGNLAKIALAPAAPSPFLEGSATAGYTLVGNLAVPFVATPQDADGNTIIAPGTVPAVTVAGPTGGPISVVAGTNNRFGLYASTPTAPVTITASGTNLDGKRVTTTIAVGATAAIYIANYISQTITAYDEAGTQLALPPMSFGGLTNPMGIAYVPSATPGSTGSLVITETANSSAPYVVTYDQSGVVQPLQNGAFLNTAQPLFPAYAPSEGVISLPNYGNSTVTQYDTAGTSVPRKGKFPGLASPVQIVYDADNTNYYVTSLGTFKLNRFASDGTPIGTGVSAGNHPMGVAYDGNNRRLYVAFSGQVPTLSSSPASPAGIMAFDENLATVSTSGGFTNASTTAAYIGILFDPFNKQLYVTDAGNNAVLAFTEAGTAVPLAAGAFGKLNDPMSLAIVP